MKKLLYLSFAVLVAVASLSSCNKKLKKELDELETSVNDLKSKNTTLENSLNNVSSDLNNANSTLNNVNSAFETNNPINWTFNGNDGATAISRSYSAKYLTQSKSNVQYIEDEGDNVWNLYVEKSEDFDNEDYAYFNLYKNVATGVLATGRNQEFSGRHYDAYNGGRTISGYADYLNGTPIGGSVITLNRFDLNTTTGEVSIDLNWSIGGYTFSSGTESGTASWAGTCFIYN